ncbi:hypothetical protein [Konateibacter massiliensis]|uniref:hypothetical protein n=1 Tax=Konateibacter massiliensis TaxID=2002841 RepID=UPI000C15D892|nr:hypothetical protein [Konateibacter massiliensis]
MKKIGILVLAALVLAGCGEQPIDLTEQESQAIATYAAHVTLQYDKNYSRKLVAVSTEETEEATEEVMSDAEEQVNLPQDKQGEAAVQNVSDGEATAEGEEAVGEAELSEPEITQEAASIAELFKQEDFQITYEGALFGKKYMNIDRGNTAQANNDDLFLILNFKVTNMTEETQVCDIASLAPRLRVSINGAEYVDVYDSMLNNDLSVLYTEIGANSTQDAILLIEIPQEYNNNVSTLSLKSILGDEAYSIVLK